jgi:hypothetical protein
MTSQVAIAPWTASDRLPGAGVVLYPSQHSNNLLLGAILLTSPFPDFIVLSPTASFSPSPALLSPRHPTYPQSPYSNHMYPSSYPSTSHHILPHSISHQLPPSPGPTNYAHTIPRHVPAGSLPSPSTAGQSSWSTMTDPDDEGF